jgi:adenine deaminase
MADLARRLAVARGDQPADLIVRGGRVLSVFTREWLETDVAVADGYVAGLGDYEGAEEIDASGRFVVPGFIDAHMHLESPKLLPDEFARLVLPLGTTTVIADPHELANVLGTDGVHWLLDFCAELPLDVYFMASSCVPASRFESPRRALNEGDLQGLLRRRRVLGLAEMMNFPGVIAGDESELTKLGLTGATHVDGHAPGVVGKQLNAYAAAGIRSDHEALTVEEGRERLRAGMWLLIREASMARNLHALLPLVEEFGTARIAFCTDDKDPDDIAERGHINGMVRDAVAAGIAPENALVLASLNAAVWHGLQHLGALAPGYQADVLVLPDLESFQPELVLKAGRTVDEIARSEVPEWVKHTVRIEHVGPERFRIEWPEGRAARVIGLVPDQIVTESLVEKPTVRDGEAVADPERDLAKIAVLERHLGTGHIGRGFVRGFELERGALASTVAHDAHNIVVVGMDDADMASAVERLAELGGGIVAVEDGEVLAELPLPVGGLLSDLPLDEVVKRSRACTEAAERLGCSGSTPFLTMSFLALSVIPSLKITDQGLVDVDRFELVPLEAG